MSTNGAAKPLPSLTDERSIEVLLPPPNRITSRIVRAIDELNLQQGVIAGDQRKTEQAERAAESIYLTAHAEMVHLAEGVVTIQRRDRDPEAQRYVDWFTEEMMPHAGTDMLRIARTGVHSVAQTASRPIYPEEDQEQVLGFWQRLLGPR